MVMIDPELVKRSSGARILGLISERDQRFEVQQQPHPNLISFWREVLEGKEMPGNQVFGRKTVLKAYHNTSSGCPRRSYKVL